MSKSCNVKNPSIINPCCGRSAASVGTKCVLPCPLHETSSWGQKAPQKTTNKSTKTPNQKQGPFGLGAARPSQLRPWRELCCHLLAAPGMAPAAGPRTSPPSEASELEATPLIVYQSSPSSSSSLPSLNVLKYFNTSSYRPTVSSTRSSLCVHSSQALAKLTGSEVEHELQSFNHCPLLTFLKCPLCYVQPTKKQQNALSQMTFLNFVM